MSEEKSMSLAVLGVVVETPSFYRIVTALRGPDAAADNLKYLFTCRIRRLLGRWCVGSMRDHREVPFELIMDAYQEALNAWRKGVNIDHYLSHVYDAVWTLQSLSEIDGETRRELNDLRRLAYAFIVLLSQGKDMEEAEEELKRLYEKFEVIKCDGGADKEDK